MPRVRRLKYARTMRLELQEQGMPVPCATGGDGGLAHDGAGDISWCMRQLGLRRVTRATGWRGLPYFRRSGHIRLSCA
jgi:hypothetical protein